MRNFTPIIILFLLVSFNANAQNYIYRGSSATSTNQIAPEQDSVVVVEKAPALDSTLYGVSIFSLLGNDVKINQSSAVKSGMSKYLSHNKKRAIQGYRIRIFFDNKRTARTESEECAKAFSEQYPQIGVYRQYENPYFKVTVGDFRTKSDAMKFLNTIKHQYPGVFIVKGTINYPL